ncbi:MAG: thermostable hemolysin [Gammaproteobacteria bacterium]|nr:thermostable hemolysin [Gammaproteobacteria bacterium]MBL4898896.1 thermostable hemolysin [Colwellia sp.]
MSQAGVIDNYSCYVRNANTVNTETSLYLEEGSGRQDLERYISNKYLQVHGAHINEYLPILAGVQAGGELAGAFGLRPGQYRPMFLEQYLDAPIEQQVASITKQPVDRCALMEIGNLAITRTGYGPLVMVLLSMSLAEAGYEWMVFTVTEQVERLMKCLGFEPHYLVSADPDRLDGDQLLWGSYYQNNPRVMVGSLKTVSEIIARDSRLSNIAVQQRENIADIASSLRDYRRLGEID